MVIKLISHTGNFGWGFFVDVILLIVVGAGAWMGAQASAGVSASDETA
jgi:hypothetical protein